MTTSSTPTQADGKRTVGKKAAARREQHGVQGGSSEANRIAVAILEVLAGARSPAEAAAALSVSLPRYYLLETRALGGMVTACEPKPQGKQPSPNTRIASLEKELQRALRECARQQALVRVAQRSVGLSAAETQKGKPSCQRDRRGRKRRHPAVRALKAANTLRSRLASAKASEVQPNVCGETTADSGKVNRSEVPAAASC